MSVENNVGYVFSYYGEGGIFVDTMLGVPMTIAEARLLVLLMAKIDHDFDSFTREKGKYVILFLREFMSCGMPGFSLSDRMCKCIGENGDMFMKGIKTMTDHLIALHKEK